MEFLLHSASMEERKFGIKVFLDYFNLYTKFNSIRYDRVYTVYFFSCSVALYIEKYFDKHPKKGRWKSNKLFENCCWWFKTSILAKKLSGGADSEVREANTWYSNVWGENVITISKKVLPNNFKIFVELTWNRHIPMAVCECLNGIE